MTIPNLIPHKVLYISGYICSCYAFVFIFDFPGHISKHILQFHAFLLTFLFETGWNFFVLIVNIQFSNLIKSSL
ncbi:hypothetical protein SAMN05444001_10980 [Parabacteroides chinchillae]|uniref:Uncharacterized protein n=1 Tax=Parabacteroides chinchillae TaxID=871327 RepID=A0A8G2BWM4_9BACT|nr:hypothetical protein SAMN05444001_10980 [Parabacteroides chinchillae]